MRKLHFLLGLTILGLVLVQLASSNRMNPHSAVRGRFGGGILNDNLNVFDDRTDESIENYNIDVDDDGDFSIKLGFDDDDDWNSPE